jgi:Yip1 domain
MTTEEVLPPLEAPRRIRFDWLPDAFFRPRRAFDRVLNTSGVWLTPILILSLTALIGALIAGSIRQAAALSGQVNLPPDFQYYSPEQQAQYQQAMSATSSPVFLYVFPALVALSKVWVGWLLVGGLLHLVMTLLGGRGDTGAAMNLVAWAGLPFAVRDVVRIVAMLSSKQLIASPGLSGFAPIGEGFGVLFLAGLLGSVDIYLIWYFLLLVLGVRLGNGINRLKAVSGVFFVLVLIFSVQAALVAFAGQLGGLTIIRPFF